MDTLYAKAQESAEIKRLVEIYLKKSKIRAIPYGVTKNDAEGKMFDGKGRSWSKEKQLDYNLRRAHDFKGWGI